MSELTIGELLTQLLSQPSTLVVMLIQFLMGLALGYISMRVLKYVLAFIAILALGTFLSVWSLGMTPAEVFSTLGLATEAVKRLATVLGILTVGPVSIGFIVGVVIGLLRK